jgi:hypothetical protein
MTTKRLYPGPEGLHGASPKIDGPVRRERALPDAEMEIEEVQQ